jgi:hypothetical protein
MGVVPYTRMRMLIPKRTRFALVLRRWILLYSWRQVAIPLWHGIFVLDAQALGNYWANALCDVEFSKRP